jgi:hypothetical protein
MKKTIVAVLIAFMTVGFDWSLVQVRSDIITITVKNQFPIPVVIQVNENYAGNTSANSSLNIKASVNNVPIKIDVWGYENPKIIATKTFTSLTRGQDIIWATGNVELKPIAPALAPSAPPAATPPPQAVANQPAPKVTAPPQAVIPPPAAPKASAPVPVAAPSLTPAPSQAATTPSAAKDSRMIYVKSASTLSFQSQKIQNRVKTASLAKIDRKKTSTGFTYALSGDGAVMVGKVGEAAFYGVSPLNVNRSAADRLSSDRRGLSPWLDIVNRTLDGLTHKHMAPGVWEESLALPFGKLGPASLKVHFRARALPAPDDKWILITADSGLVPFSALDEEYQDSLIYSRYLGVLIYSPKEDELLQSADAFTAYHGEDQLRIEQTYFAADANGNQLYPALDVGPFLNFSPEDPAVTTPGPLPSWCIQAADVLDFEHLAVMTAAEGSTNWEPISFAEQSFLNLIHHHFDLVKQVLSNGGALDFLGQWNALLMKVATKGIGDYGFWLWDVVSLDLPLTVARMPSSINWWVDINKPLYVSAKKMINGKLYDIKLINDFPYGPPVQPAQPIYPIQPTTPVQPTPPPDEVKKAPGDAVLWAILGGVLGAGAGAYELGLFGGSSSDSGASDECKSQYKQCSSSGGIEVVGFYISLSCQCPSGTFDYTESGESYRYCSGCYKPSGSSSLRSTTRTKR